MGNKIKKTLKKQGFTLVELIIVIAIIAVLAIAAFMVLTKWLGNSRDSRRIADANTIKSALTIYMGDLDNSAGLLPMPDDAVTISATGNIVNYQGNFGSDVISQLDNIQKIPLDPSDVQEYTYVINSDKTKFQILTYLEKYNDLVINLSDDVSAVDYKNRYAKTFGYDLGIITDTNRIPIQNFSITGLDLSQDDTNYGIVFEDYVLENASPSIILTNIIVNQDRYELFATDSTLVGYWDMEKTIDGKLKDFSKYENHGLLMGGIKVGGEQGLRGRATRFDGIDDYIDLGKILDGETSAFTVTLAVLIDEIQNQPCATTSTNVYNPFLSSRNYYGGGSNEQGFRYGVNYNCNDAVNWLYTVNNIDKASRLTYAQTNYTDFTSQYIDGKWDYITIVYDSGTISFYKDGVLESSIDGPAKVLLDGRDNLLVGRTDVDLGYLKGIIDDLRIYKRSMTASEVHSLYDSLKANL